MCASVAGVVGTIFPTGVYQCLIHIEYKYMFFVCSPLSDLRWDYEEFFVGEPLANVVLELDDGWVTVVKKRNCMMKFSSSLGS